ncbi:PREDICTED: yae1 domain-containing protein 1 [Nanorana parkeri]|uniref:yae1 domain-containing protein 1 n=1 Tax=Nanorana parkeri TaxID=125878 RepID=UPI00085423E3|nr:PREDICTED: yae1 domain-containing protein 1 [Nanorana parkeri]
MSWVRAAVERHEDREEEVFDEEGDEMNLLHREWQRSMEKRLKEGYVDGIDAGKENALQSGFNQGYKLGVHMLMPCGELRGTISALVTWCQVHKSDPTPNTQLGELLTAICHCEDQLVKGLSSVHQDVHPPELSSCMDDMGLGSHTHEPSNDSCAAGQDCCRKQESLSSSFLNCRTTQEMNNIMKHELGRILKDTHSIAQQLNVSSDLLCYLQTLELKHSLI